MFIWYGNKFTDSLMMYETLWKFTTHFFARIRNKWTRQQGTSRQDKIYSRFPTKRKRELNNKEPKKEVEIQSKKWDERKWKKITAMASNNNMFWKEKKYIFCQDKRAWKRLISDFLFAFLHFRFLYLFYFCFSDFWMFPVFFFYSKFSSPSCLFLV